MSDAIRVYALLGCMRIYRDGQQYHRCICNEAVFIHVNVFFYFELQHYQFFRVAI